MKKVLKKLSLSRETLGSLGAVVGGYSFPCLSIACSAACHPDGGGTDSCAGTCDTCGVCSNGCATGGACTT